MGYYSFLSELAATRSLKDVHCFNILSYSGIVYEVLFSYMLIRVFVICDAFIHIYPYFYRNRRRVFNNLSNNRTLVNNYYRPLSRIKTLVSCFVRLIISLFQFSFKLHIVCEEDLKILFALFAKFSYLNIMKFSLTDYQRDHLELKAHNSYVQGMCLVGAKQGSPILSSVCKEGTIKFWDITSTRRMKLIEEIPKAHSDAINSVCSNSFMMFTASSDQTIGFWKQNKQE
uniref:WD_REPEATS_REGION domain-containing protein n=1 Tax=Heterorhabditis bacteriophora TaxID=37862 RepID=A0A1I7WY34_HETBA